MVANENWRVHANGYKKSRRAITQLHCLQTGCDGCKPLTSSCSATAHTKPQRPVRHISEDAKLLHPPMAGSNSWSKVGVPVYLQPVNQDMQLSNTGANVLQHRPTTGMSNMTAPLVPLMWSLGAWLVLFIPPRWPIRAMRLGYMI